MKKVIWGFWGCGKSRVADGVNIIDADCEVFKFVGVNKENLHSISRDAEKIYRNLDYPENYVAYVQQCEADIVLVNCELSVLKRFDSVYLYYPSQSRKDEFIHRYIQRGDDTSFVTFLENEYERILTSLSFTPYPRYVAIHANTYLSDLLKSGGKIDMSGFMTKKEIITLIENAKRLNIESIKKIENKSNEEIAQELFEGKVSLDIEQVQNETSKAQKEYEDSFCGTYLYEDNKKVQAIQVVRGFGSQKDEIWVRERKGREDETYSYYGFQIFNKDGILLENMEKFQSMLNNGFHKTDERFEVGIIEKNDLEGFSHTEAVNIVMDAIAMGVIQAHHGEIYPYSFGFEYSYKGHGTGKGNFNPFKYPEWVIRKIELNEFSGLPLHEIKQDIEKARKEYDITKITPYKNTTEFKRKQASSWERGLIANYSYVRQGYAVDGIIEGSCHGDYSSITTNRQNEWMQAVVPLRGYCLDYVYEAAGGTKYLPYLEEIIKYYQAKGIDITNEDFICDWINQNRDKCYFEENRTYNDITKKENER